jgi:hypothetical protein
VVALAADVEQDKHMEVGSCLQLAPRPQQQRLQHSLNVISLGMTVRASLCLNVEFKGFIKKDRKISSSWKAYLEFFCSTCHHPICTLENQRVEPPRLQLRLMFFSVSLPPCDLRTFKTYAE